MIALKSKLAVLLFVVVGVSALSAQTFVFRNPYAVTFVCPDHDLDDQHEVDIIRETDGQLVRTVLIGDPPLTGSLVIAPINIRPEAFGSYRFVVRAVAGTAKSESSEASSVWQRQPSKPLNVEPR